MSGKEHRTSSRREVVAYSDSDEYSNKVSRSGKDRKKRHRQIEEYDDSFKVKEKKKSKHDSSQYQLDSDEYYTKKPSKSKKKDRKENFENEDFTSKKRDSSDERQDYGRHPSNNKYSSHKTRQRRNVSERLSDEETFRKSKQWHDSEDKHEKSSYEYTNRKNSRMIFDESSPEHKRKRRHKHQEKNNKGHKEGNRMYSKGADEKNGLESQGNHLQRHSENSSEMEFDKYRRRGESIIEKDASAHRDEVNKRKKMTGLEEGKQKDDAEYNESIEPLSKRQKIVNINMRTGGAYIPPARLRMMQDQIKDKGSKEYQKIAWEALKKSIIGMTNKVNGSNIAEIVPELFRENIIRGRGVLARAIMQAQAASPTFTRVYAALVAIINIKFPEIGELILKRLIVQYKRGFRRNDKTVCMAAVRFLAHLLNQEVAHEVLVLEIVTHLLENPSEDSVEVAIACLKECGKKLVQLSPRGMRAITQRVLDVLHEGTMDVRIHYMIEVFFAIQKDGFKDFEIMPQELDLIEEDDRYTHLINLDDAVDGQEMLNIFKFDPDYLENEEKYKSVVKEILGEESEEEGSGNESGSGDEENDDEEKNEESQQIIDMTETNLVCLRRKIYLTIQSSLDFEECAHKLLRLELKPGQILEMCYMILDCCAQQRTYEKFYGLLAQRFCQLSKIYVEPFTEIFENSYKTIHRLETNKLRNVAKFFAHLLYTDAISWMVLKIIKLNEEDTTSSSRIFIKILFQELCEYLGLPKLNERVKDITLQEAFDGLFPRDHPHNTRFAINFFTSIGLGGLTDELREHLKNLPKNPVLPPQNDDESPEEEASSSSSSSTSSSSSSSSTSSEEQTRRKKLQKRRKK